LKTLSSLRISLTNQPVSWVQEFLELRGLECLIAILKMCHSENAIFSFTNVREMNSTQLEALKSIRCLINNKSALKDAYRNAPLVLEIVHAVYSPSLTNRKLSLELLCVFCYQDPPLGHKSVLNAMDIHMDLMKRPSRFQYLCDNLKSYCGKYDSGTEKEVIEYMVGRLTRRSPTCCL
jgi:hypothetical protein